MATAAAAIRLLSERPNLRSAGNACVAVFIPAARLNHVIAQMIPEPGSGQRLSPRTGLDSDAARVW
ncbi:hypothetical protein AE618_03270 [Bosea vaviloviae]|uniref:Uncharacterized protein n=1 Tax=Bosea vaviloviae TaxID=1526658 RepID=A0A0N1FH48_9HYPH|nr:hypothetical protein AE618_03270 [Bosea vaviloviae]